MLLSLFLVCFVSLVLSTGMLIAFGHRLRVAFRPLGMLLAVVLVLVSGESAGWAWRLPSGYVLRGELVLLAVTVPVILLRRRWNPIGQVFYGSLLASALAYLAFAVDTTFLTGLSPLGTLASGSLLVLEFVALFLATTFAFESCDVICRVRWDRPFPEPDASYLPKVSLQIAAYNEPPDLLIETIRSVEAIDYPNLEVVVIDNNTKDPDVWGPVEAYCRGTDRVTFVHVDPWPGYKSGALNLALTKHTAPDAEIVGVIDADYLVDPSYLRSLVGYFADPEIAFVQTPQDYRDFEGDPYLTACYDAYRYFFATTMPSRNERNSIIFAGTMGLIRRAVLEELGGWDEWCITEDAEASLRMLKAGYSGLYVGRSFGRGIMPLSFASLKSQRFRWCFGGMQILRRHWRELAPWDRDPENRLSLAQRFDYLLGGVQWLNDLVYLGFSVVLLSTAAVLLTKGRVGIRPLLGAAVLLPSALIASGLIRAVWALRLRTRIGPARSVRAFANWLALSWTVALACIQGLVRSEGVFLRTPKSADEPGVFGALWAARTETLLATSLWIAGALVALRGVATPFMLVLFGWQGVVYAMAPYMSLLNQGSRLPPHLERRRRTERLRERGSRRAGFFVGGLAGASLAGALALVLFLGGSNPGRPSNPFALPHRAPGDSGPLGNLIKKSPIAPSPSVSPTASVTPSPTGSPSPTPSTSPSPTPSASGTPSAPGP